MKRYPVLTWRINLAKLASLLICLAAWFVIAGSTAWGGTIKGSVRFTGAAVEQKKFPVTTDQYVCGTEIVAEDIVLSSNKGLRNAVVSLQDGPPGAKWKAPLSTVRIDQKQCMYMPHVVVVPVGGTVEFLNGDRLVHNHRSTSTANAPFNLAHPTARPIRVVFKQPEIVHVQCDFHPWMRAWVVVADHPFYAVTTDRGEFTVNNVPPGKYTLQVWQESLGTVTKGVTVGDKGITTVAVEMSQK